MNQPFHITVIGQGYVGLPLSLSFAMNGAAVIGSTRMRKLPRT